jgi:hypothetical protein
MTKHSLPSESYQSLIEAVRARVGAGVGRIADAPHPFQATWWPETPTFQDEIRSIYNDPTPFPNLMEAFREEVEAVREAQATLELQAPAERRGEGQEGLMKRLGRARVAQFVTVRLWADIAVPVRRVGDVVCRLVPRGEGFDQPIVQTLQVDEYISGVAAKTADFAVEITALKRGLWRWRVVSVALLLAAVVVVLRRLP